MIAQYRAYDHRVQHAIAKTGNPNLFPQLNIPRSTTLTWIRKGARDVVTLDELDDDHYSQLQRIADLENKVTQLSVERELMIHTFRLFGLQIQYRRLPDAEAKTTLLSLIRNAAETLPLSRCLEVIGLSTARYYSWLKRQVRCQLPDRSSCPKLSPNSLTSDEISEIKELVTSKDFVAYTIPSLMWFAKREGKVFASLSSWYRMIKDLGLKRALQRIHPPKPKVGIRASAPNQIWHVDLTILRLECGIRVYIQAVIDNFSRHILAWHASLDYGGLRTKALLERALTAASEFYPDTFPTVLVDGGSENDNEEVNQLIIGKLIHRLIARVDIDFSNSMIEAFFLTLKHRWLYLLSLTSFETVVAALEKYIPEYTHRIPRDVHQGGVPFEVYTGLWTEESKSQLKEVAVTARVKRLAANKSVSCGNCP